MHLTQGLRSASHLPCNQPALPPFFSLMLHQNPMLWSLVLALVISVSGLRRFLDPASPAYIDGLGWIVLTLQQIAGITVPLALFSNGVW